MDDAKRVAVAQLSAEADEILSKGEWTTIESRADYKEWAWGILAFVQAEQRAGGDVVERRCLTRIAAALAQSAADERKRCEAIARAAENYGAEFPVGSYESTYKHGRHGRDAAKDIADAIAALAETKGEGK